MHPNTGISLLLDFGAAPVCAEPLALSMLEELSSPALMRLWTAIRSWAVAEGVTGVNIFLYRDPEGSSAWEAVLELRLDAEAPAALRRWKALAEVVDQAKSQLENSERCLLDRHLSVQLVWRDEP